MALVRAARIPTHASDACGLTFPSTRSSATGEQSWPLCHFMYILLSYNSSGASDCSQVDTLLRFIAWIQLNDNVRSLSLPPHSRRHAMKTVRCSHDAITIIIITPATGRERSRRKGVRAHHQQHQEADIR